MKALLFEPLGEAEGRAEGVWVLIAEGDQSAGIGVLLSNAVSLGGEVPSRGDVVECRTIDPAHNLYIVGWVDGRGS